MLSLSQEIITHNSEKKYTSVKVYVVTILNCWNDLLNYSKNNSTLILPVLNINTTFYLLDSIQIIAYKIEKIYVLLD